MSVIDEKKIAVLGTTPSRMEAPIADPTWQIWTIGPGGKDMHRWDRLYETHTVWPEDFAQYLNDLSNVKLPQTVRSIVPMKARMIHWANRHGKDEKWLKEKITGDWSSNIVIDRDDMFDRYSRTWFSTSICYAVADAIDDHVERSDAREKWYRKCVESWSEGCTFVEAPPPEAKTTIGCFGIDLESDEEHLSQYIGCKHLLDIAKLIGIDIILPNGCGLERDLNPYPDRYETHLALTYEKKLKLLNNLIGQAEQDLEGRKMMLYRIEGAILKLREVSVANPKAFDPSLLATGEQELIKLKAEFDQVQARLQQLRGERSATEYYQRMYVWGMLSANAQA